MILLLRKANLIFSFLVIFCGLYIIALPVIPEIEYKVRSETEFKYPSMLNVSQDMPSSPIPSENRLVIPKIGVDGEIHEGDKEALDKGIWHRPSTGDPVRGGNTVIVAHRFLYNSGPITFYHLDKLSIGDKFSIYWEGIEYLYQINEILEVTPDQIEIENVGFKNMVTLYTCTPLFTAEKRLVVRAIPLI